MRAAVSSSFAQMQQHAGSLVELVFELRPVRRAYIGNARAGAGKRLVAGIVYDAHRRAVGGLHIVALERNALAGGNSPEQALGLGVARNRCQEPRIARARDRGHRPRHMRLVIGIVLPLPAIGEFLRHAPKLERVVTEMIVQLDQAREDDPCGVHRCCVGKSGGWRRGSIRYRRDRVTVDIDRTIREHSERAIHHHDPAQQHEFHHPLPE